MADTGQLLRNVAGLTGLVALGAVIFGAARAPVLPVVWTILVLGSASEPPTQPTHKVMLTWIIQPADTRSAMVAALAIAVAGSLTYALLGSRR